MGTLERLLEGYALVLKFLFKDRVFTLEHVNKETNLNISSMKFQMLVEQGYLTEKSTGLGDFVYVVGDV